MKRHINMQKMKIWDKRRFYVFLGRSNWKSLIFEVIIIFCFNHTMARKRRINSISNWLEKYFILKKYNIYLFINIDVNILLKMFFPHLYKKLKKIDLNIMIQFINNNSIFWENFLLSVVRGAFFWISFRNILNK